LPQLGVAALAVIVPTIPRPPPTMVRVAAPAAIFALTDIQILLGLLAQLPVTVAGWEIGLPAASSHVERLEAARRPFGSAASPRCVSEAERLECGRRNKISRVSRSVMNKSLRVIQVDVMTAPGERQPELVMSELGRRERKRPQIPGS
jgi:hypothetical protein